LKRLLYIMTYYLGINRLFYFLNRKKQRVLTYHNVISDVLFDNALHLGVSCSQSTFHWQIEYLKKRFRFVTEPGIEGSCVITFDDGYQNNFRVARPTLDKFGVMAYFFVPLDSVGNAEPLWVDKALMWVSYVPQGDYTLWDEDFSISGEPSRRALWQAIWERALLSPDFQKSLANALEQVFPFADLPVCSAMMQERFEHMDHEQISGLKSAGHLVGAHSLNHLILATLDKSALADDFSKCAKGIGSVYNTEVYSYPFGGEEEVSPPVIEQCEGSEFSMAFMNSEQGHRQRPSSPFAMARMSLPSSTDRFLIDARLSGVEAFLRGMLKRISA